MLNWIKGRIGERTSWDGAVCIALGSLNNGRERYSNRTNYW